METLEVNDIDTKGDSLQYGKPREITEVAFKVVDSGSSLFVGTEENEDETDLKGFLGENTRNTEDDSYGPIKQRNRIKTNTLPSCWTKKGKVVFKNVDPTQMKLVGMVLNFD